MNGYTYGDMVAYYLLVMVSPRLLQHARSLGGNRV